MARIGPDEVRERYGIEPHQVPDFIALRGDPSDKLPGARGIGPKGAAVLLRQYGTLERILAEGRLGAQAAELKLYKKIATMDATAPLPALHDQTPTWNTAAELAREWDLDRLARRLDGDHDAGEQIGSCRPHCQSRPVGRRASEQMLKIATFNINNVNRRLPNLLGWLHGSQPNVVCLQELKSTDDAFPAAAIQEAGYRAIWRGQRTYNGVAILTNIGEPQQTRDRLPGDQDR